MTTGKTIALTRWTFVYKIMSLIFNMLSRLVITFLPRTNRLLISWLQSPSAVILEPRKIQSATVVSIPKPVYTRGMWIVSAYSTTVWTKKIWVQKENYFYFNKIECSWKILKRFSSKLFSFVLTLLPATQPQGHRLLLHASPFGTRSLTSSFGTIIYVKEGH